MPSFRQVYIPANILWPTPRFKSVDMDIWDTEFRGVYVDLGTNRNLVWSNDFRRIEFNPGEIYDWSNTMSQLIDLLNRMTVMEDDLETFLTNFKGRTLLNGTTTKNVLSKTWTGTVGDPVLPTDEITIAHGLSDVTLIGMLTVIIRSAADGKWKAVTNGVPSNALTGFKTDVNTTNIIITQVQSAHARQPYVVLMEYRED